MTGTMMPKSKKPLKDPNKKGPLDKFAPIFAVVGLVYALVNGTFSILDWTKVGAREKQQEKRIENFIKEEVDMQVRLRFPDSWETEIYDYNKKVIDPPLNRTEIETLIKSLSGKNENIKCKGKNEK